MDKALWLRFLKMLTIALIIALGLFFMFSKVIVEDEVDHQELEEAKNKVSF